MHKGKRQFLLSLQWDFIDILSGKLLTH